MSLTDDIINLLTKNLRSEYLEIIRVLEKYADNIKEIPSENLLIVASHGYCNCTASCTLEIYDTRGEEKYLNYELFDEEDSLNVNSYDGFNEDIVKLLMNYIGITEYNFEDNYWDD